MKQEHVITTSYLIFGTILAIAGFNYPEGWYTANGWIANTLIAVGCVVVGTGFGRLPPFSRWARNRSSN